MNVKLLRSRGARVAGAVAGALGVVLLLSLSTGTLAAEGSNVVPPTGKVAGHGYAYWMQRHWQLVFSMKTASSVAKSPCKTLTANGKQVAFLSAPHSTGTYTCSEPAGRPIYANVVGIECDTFAGEHIGFGTSDAQLEQCSRHYLAGVGTPSATVDGHVVDIKGLLAATGAFPIHAVAGNPFGVPAGNGRAAAYGYGLLLTGFSKGTHVIHWTVTPGADLTYTVRTS